MIRSRSSIEVNAAVVGVWFGEIHVYFLTVYKLFVSGKICFYTSVITNSSAVSRSCLLCLEWLETQRGCTDPTERAKGVTSLDSEALRAIFFQQISSCFVSEAVMVCCVPLPI